MKIRFIKGSKLFDDTNYKYVIFSDTACLGLFMNKYTQHYRYEQKNILKRIQANDKTFIYVVKQDNPIDTLRTLIHELCHHFIFLLFSRNRVGLYLNKLLDRIDHPR